MSRSRYLLFFPLILSFPLFGDTNYQEKISSLTTHQDEQSKVAEAQIYDLIPDYSKSELVWLELYNTYKKERYWYQVLLHRVYLGTDISEQDLNLLDGQLKGRSDLINIVRGSYVNNSLMNSNTPFFLLGQEFDSSVHSNQVIIQVGVYSHKNYADLMINTLKKLGFVPELRQSNSFYKVMIKVIDNKLNESVNVLSNNNIEYLILP
ncbi:SPOR domain-containing protein [Spirochaeta cellobiosiphila]|uniref:SPOR domain-containing protein n=1 Tax=Spirochaeta cellobiosiphila TaxID=504483 RepID=UPI00041EC82C|nr:hypothetical protein [Spirochaeta cellobiosiphila]